jgi:hypothetical protein
MSEYKLIVAGSRRWDDMNIMVEYTEKFWHQFVQGKYDKFAIISGTARGADQMAIKMADDRLIPVICMPGDWHAHGKRAGYLRNLDMANIATGCIVFWDGTSKGSLHMWNTALQKGLDSMLVRRSIPAPIIEEIVVPNNKLVRHRLHEL